MASRRRQPTAADIDTSTPEGRVAFKENASRVLHEALDARDLCSAADAVLVRVGLLPRESYRNRQGDPEETARYLQGQYPGLEITVREGNGLTGEDTQEAFDEWKRSTAETLHAEARNAGLNQDYNDTLREAGFQAKEQVDVVVEGTFKVPVKVWRLEGEDVIDGISREDIAAKVHNVLFYEEGNRYRRREDEAGVEVDWKARVAEEAS